MEEGKQRYVEHENGVLLTQATPATPPAQRSLLPPSSLSCLLHCVASP